MENNIFFSALETDGKNTIDKISSLSCQKVADTITSSKMGKTVAKQASVLLRNIPEYIRRYLSAYCTIYFLMNKSNPYTTRRGVVGKMISIQETYYAKGIPLG